MTNNQQMFMNQRHERKGRDLSVQTQTDYNQAIVRDRIAEREAEAVSARLASGGRRPSGPQGFRPALGRALIRAGRAIAQEPAAVRDGGHAGRAQGALGARS
jgi:hypothetical protein